MESSTDGGTGPLINPWERRPDSTVLPFSRPAVPVFQAEDATRYADPNRCGSASCATASSSSEPGAGIVERRSGLFWSDAIIRDQPDCSCASRWATDASASSKGSWHHSRGATIRGGRGRKACSGRGGGRGNGPFFSKGGCRGDKRNGSTVGGGESHVAAGANALPHHGRHLHPGSQPWSSDGRGRGRGGKGRDGQTERHGRGGRGGGRGGQVDGHSRSYPTVALNPGKGSSCAAGGSTDWGWAAGGRAPFRLPLECGGQPTPGRKRPGNASGLGVQADGAGPSLDAVGHRAKKKQRKRIPEIGEGPDRAHARGGGDEECGTPREADCRNAAPRSSRTADAIGGVRGVSGACLSTIEPSLGHAPPQSGDATGSLRAGIPASSACAPGVSAEAGVEAAQRSFAGADGEADLALLQRPQVRHTVFLDFSDSSDGEVSCGDSGVPSVARAPMSSRDNKQQRVLLVLSDSSDSEGDTAACATYTTTHDPHSGHPGGCASRSPASLGAQRSQGPLAQGPSAVGPLSAHTPGPSAVPPTRESAAAAISPGVATASATGLTPAPASLTATVTPPAPSVPPVPAQAMCRRPAAAAEVPSLVSAPAAAAAKAAAMVAAVASAEAAAVRDVRMAAARAAKGAAAAAAAVAEEAAHQAALAQVAAATAQAAAEAAEALVAAMAEARDQVEGVATVAVGSAGGQPPASHATVAVTDQGWENLSARGALVDTAAPTEAAVEPAIEIMSAVAPAPAASTADLAATRDRDAAREEAEVAVATGPDMVSAQADAASWPAVSGSAVRDEALEDLSQAGEAKRELAEIVTPMCGVASWTAPWMEVTEPAHEKATNGIAPGTVLGVAREPAAPGTNGIAAAAVPGVGVTEPTHVVATNEIAAGAAPGASVTTPVAAEVIGSTPIARKGAHPGSSAANAEAWPANTVAALHRPVPTAHEVSETAENAAERVGVPSAAGNCLYAVPWYPVPMGGSRGVECPAPSAEQATNEMRADRSLQAAHEVSAYESALGYRCLDLEPDGQFSAPRVDAGSMDTVTEWAAAHDGLPAMQRILRWRCQAGHLFGASLQMFSEARRRRCPTCEAIQLGSIATTLEPGSVCEQATYAPLPPPKKRYGNKDAAPPTPPDFPLLAQNCWFEVMFRCQRGHRWQTHEHLVTRGFNVVFGRSEIKSSGHYRSSESYSSRRCPDCQVGAQQQLLRSAAAHYYKPDGVVPPSRAASAPAPGGSNTSFETAATHCERLLRLGPAASARQVLGLPVGGALDPAATKRHFRNLARLLHPDKCDLPNAADAFKRVLDAFESMEKGSAGW